MDSLTKIWSMEIGQIKSFLSSNNIKVPKNNIKAYIKASKLAATLGLLSKFETDLVNM